MTRSLGGKWNERIELTERFLDVLSFIDQRGGTYQRTLPNFANDVDLSEHVVRKCTQRMVDLGIMRIDSGGSPILGIGRFPNTYVLLVTAEEWLMNRDRLLEAFDARRQKVRDEKAAKLRKQRVTKKVDDRLAAKAKAKMPERVWPPPAAPVQEPSREQIREQLGKVDVDAWADFDDF